MLGYSQNILKYFSFIDVLLSIFFGSECDVKSSEIFWKFSSRFGDKSSTDLSNEVSLFRNYNSFEIKY